LKRIYHYLFINAVPVSWRKAICLTQVIVVLQAGGYFWEKFPGIEGAFSFKAPVQG